MNKSQIYYQFKKLPTDSGEIERLAEILGVSMYNTASTKHGHTGTDTYEVQRRIREALKGLRDSSLWLLALVSAVASVISAFAAWAAVS